MTSLSGVRILTGVDQIPGDLPDFDVEVLRGSAQNNERRFRGDPFSLHENSHCLAYRLATCQSGVEVRGPAFLVLMGVGDRQSEAGQRHQYGRFGSAVNPEGGGIARVEVERTHLCVGRQRKSQHAANSGLASEGSEAEPTKVPLKVVGVEDEPVRDGVETRSLASTVLQCVDLRDDRIGVRRGLGTPVTSTGGAGVGLGVNVVHGPGSGV